MLARRLNWIFLALTLLGASCLYAQELYDTHKRYFRDEQYTAERAELHKSIIANTTSNIASAAKPVLIVFIGGPGSGKSTVLQQFDQARLIDKSSFVIANSDLIKKKLPEYHEFKEVAVEKAAALVHRESVEVRTQVLYQAAAQSQNIILEMAAIEAMPPEQLLGIKKALFPNYQFVLVHVEAELDTMISRANKRAEMTGRWVSADKVQSGRANSAELFRSIRQAADLAFSVKTKTKIPLIDQVSVGTRNFQTAIEIPIRKMIEKVSGGSSQIKKLQSWVEGQLSLQFGMRFCSNLLTIFGRGS